MLCLVIPVFSYILLETMPCDFSLGQNINRGQLPQVAYF